MKFKLFFGILVVLVSSIMLMANAVASPGPNIWMNQATLSIQDDKNSQDPENSGYTTTQVVVWQEEESPGGPYDIYMKYSLNDGAPGSWVFPPVQPAATPEVNERHPAVAVSRIHPDSAQEIHIVYGRDNGNDLDVCHTWTINYGATWTVPVVLDTQIEVNAREPAIVYTEDLGNPSPANPGMLMQIVWAEQIDSQSNLHQIIYDAFYWDPFLPPPRGYISTWVAPPIIIRTSPWGGDCRNPEIASVDEFDPLRVMFVDYDFSVVWEEDDPRPPRNSLRDVWYVDGRTITSPVPPSVTVFPPGMLSSGGTNDYHDPDIAAAQDYQWAMETHYFHVDWVCEIPPSGTTPRQYQIESSYAIGAGSTPGFWSFVPTAVAKGPVKQLLDKPTIASKLVSLSPTVFETWMAWEDNQPPVGSRPDIWYTVGTCTVANGFVYSGGGPPWRVGYVPGVGGGSIEKNPELWNRNDWIRNFPPLTHLVFDQDVGSGIREVVYIDP